MSDIHRLPLLGHDLPEVEVFEVSEDQMRSLWHKAKVYKSETWLGEPAWRWKHMCIGRVVAMQSYPYLDWSEAQDRADRHARGCC